jgi:hypothetical protein
MIESGLKDNEGVESSYGSIGLPTASLDALWNLYAAPCSYNMIEETSLTKERLVFETGLKRKLLRSLSMLCLSPHS